jgi:trehalose/maltose transport system permease protein
MSLLLLAGLQLIPNDLYEAADVDGAGKIRQFLSITLPLLRPALTVALIFRTLDALRVFDVFNVLLARTRYSMASYAQDQLIQYQNAGLSSASSVVIFVLILVFALLYIRALGVEAE